MAKWVGDPTPEKIERVVDLTLDECVCLQPGDDTTFDATKYSSQRILDAEAEILAAASDPSWTIAPHPAEHLGDDQVRAVETLTAKPHRVATIIGPAGAGKTTMLKSVAESYRRADRPVCVLALAANAARVVTDETGLTADTIASRSRRRLQLPKNGLVLVDEASMVPTLTLRQLVLEAHANGSRLGLVGDYAQMGSPDAGGLLRDLASLPSATKLTSVRRFRERWERSASIQLHERQPVATLHYFEHDRIIETTSEHGHDSVAGAWFADRTKGLESLIVVDTNSEAADISATCRDLLDRAGVLGDAVGIGADRNELRIGDQIQTRDNDSRLRTSDGRRVLNRDVWTVTSGTDDGTVLAKHVRHCRTVEITPEYVEHHTVLAYGATIAGAQGRTTDTGHVLVSPRTNAASLYVGMTRGRQTNHAHVVTDGHDHDELDIGRKTGFQGFADALARNPDGDTSATTVKKQYAAAEAQRIDARNNRLWEQADRTLWEKSKLGLPDHILTRLDGLDEEIVRAIGAVKYQQPAAIRFAIGRCDWSGDDAGRSFIGLLGQAPNPHLAPSHYGPSSYRGPER